MIAIRRARVAPILAIVVRCFALAGIVFVVMPVFLHHTRVVMVRAIMGGIMLVMPATSKQAMCGERNGREEVDERLQVQGPERTSGRDV